MHADLSHKAREVTDTLGWRLLIEEQAVSVLVCPRAQDALTAISGQGHTWVTHTWSGSHLGHAYVVRVTPGSHLRGQGHT